MNKVEPKKLADYAHDFALWSAEQAAFLRARKLDRIDIENVAEEIAGLGSSQESEIESRLAVLIAHLLKWQFQPGKRSGSWEATIFEQRSRIARVLRRSPSLKRHPFDVLAEEYAIGRRNAAGETQLPLATFPEICPYTIEQILDPDFLPGRA